VTATHRTKGELPVKKYKSKKKMVQADGYVHVAETTAGDLVRLADYQVAQLPGDIVSIGYSVIDPLTGIEEIYWYDAVMILDPLTGAVDYVPL